MTGLHEFREVEAAVTDFRQRSLARVLRPLDRLIYLSSMRDCNTGVYYHEGLSSRFSEQAASEALARCHFEVFREMTSAPLGDLVAQMEAYIASTHTYPADFVAVWKGLEPYRVAIPVDMDPLLTEFLFSNFKVALAILESRLNSRSAGEPASSPPPIPAQ
ncbi:MAG TPA: hypothetical protein VMJ93_13155 [Verrucomicrobiae bacterium]|nr:hypothetical protein [Verrucomicrobiae bacterium]